MNSIYKKDTYMPQNSLKVVASNHPEECETEEFKRPTLAPSNTSGFCNHVTNANVIKAKWNCSSLSSSITIHPHSSV